MKIALDATYSIGSALSGVGVYSNEILNELAASHPDTDFLHFYRPHRYLRALRLRRPANCRNRLLWERRAARGVHIFHGLNQRLPEGRWHRSICTFHDLFVLTGEYSSAEFRRRFAAQARAAATRADLVIAVSAFTASQVHELLGVERTRIRVVHHGVRIPPPRAVRKEPLIIHVGAIQRRKNIMRLVEAFERCAPKWRLAFAGSTGYGGAEILDRIESSPRRSAMAVMGYLPQQQLADLYARASILAFPSLDEGFGMPVLEAMARGVAVLTSNVSALPEVAGEAAVLVDPLNVDSIADGLERMSESESLRGTLTARGYDRAGRFRWDTAARETWAAYEEALG